MKKYSILFKTSAILSYLFLFFGLFWTTQFWRNYWEFSSWVGNVIWIRNIISLLFIGLMVWILIRSGHAYLFCIPRKKWLSYSVLTVLAAIVLICFNYLTAKHVQGTNESWNLFIAYSETNFAEFGVYLTLIVLGPLMEELVCRGLLQHAFFKNSRWGLDIYFRRFCSSYPIFQVFLVY